MSPTIANTAKMRDVLGLKSILRQRVVIHGRNLYHAAKMRAPGFIYDSVGRR